MNTFDRVKAFVDEYIALCKKHDMLMLGKTVDNLLNPADIATMRKIGMPDGWLDYYFDYLSNDDTIKFCEQVIEEHNV